MTGAGPGGPEATTVSAAVVSLCHEYVALTGAADACLVDFLADAAALAVRSLPSAQSARIRVRVPEVVTAIADAPGARRNRGPDVLAIPLVGGGDLAGVLELHPGSRDGFPADERELAEMLAVLLTLTLDNAA